MNYVTFNIEKIHNLSSLLGRSVHNSMKKRDGTDHIPASHDNLQNLDRNFHNGNAYDSINKLIAETPFENHKSKTQVPAVELVLGASSGFHKGMTPEEETKYFQDQLDWATKYYADSGKVVQADIHYTEDTPHMHLIFAPIRERITYQTQPKLDAAGNKIPKKSNNPDAQVKYEREKVLDEQGQPIIKKKKWAWSAKGFQGNKTKMAKARDSQAEYMQAKGWDLKRGKSNYFDFISGKIDKDTYITNRRKSDDHKNCTQFKQHKLDGIKQALNDVLPDLRPIFDYANEGVQVKRIKNSPK